MHRADVGTDYNEQQHKREYKHILPVDELCGGELAEESMRSSFRIVDDGLVLPVVHTRLSIPLQLHDLQFVVGNRTFIPSRYPTNAPENFAFKFYSPVSDVVGAKKRSSLPLTEAAFAVVAAIIVGAAYGDAIARERHQSDHQQENDDDSNIDGVTECVEGNQDIV